MAKNNTPSVNLNLNVRGLSQSSTLRINALSNDLRRQGRPVFKMGLGQSPFPVPEAVVEELKANAHQKDYLPVMGVRELRGSIADYFRRSQCVAYKPDNILIGPGSKELMFILQLVYYGDLLIPTPSWVSYAPQAHIIGRHIRWLSTSREDGWKLMPEELEKQCAADPDKPRLVILNYPANPSGSSYTIKELRSIARVAKKYKVVLLSDEIYGELNHLGRHESISCYYPEGTIISSGLSKWCGAGGWRLGTFAFPDSLSWLLEAMAVVSSETFTATSAPIQYAAIRAFNGGLDIERYLCQSRRILRELGILCARILIEKGVALSYPDGAFYLFPDFTPFRDVLYNRGIKTSEQMCQRILEDTGVAILPGSDFGRPPEEFTARIAYVDFDGARALAASEQTPLDQDLGEEFFERNTRDCLEAMRRIAEWFD